MSPSQISSSYSLFVFLMDEPLHIFCCAKIIMQLLVRFCLQKVDFLFVILRVNVLLHVSSLHIAVIIKSDEKCGYGKLDDFPEET